MNYSNPKNPLNRIEDVFGSVGLFVALILLFLQVLMRFVFKKSAPTLEEWSLYIFLWYTMITSSQAMLTNTHIRVEAGINRLPKKAKSILFIITQIINAIFSFIFAYDGISVVARRLALNSQSTTGFPMWIVWACIPVGMGLTGIRCIQYIYYTIKYEILDKPLPPYINPDVVDVDGVELEKDAEPIVEGGGAA